MAHLKFRKTDDGLGMVASLEEVDFLDITVIAGDGYRENRHYLWFDDYRVLEGPAPLGIIDGEFG